jgi:hypothetical protein
MILYFLLYFIFYRLKYNTKIIILYFASLHQRAPTNKRPPLPHTQALFDACLLTDEEMEQFEHYMSDQPNAVEVRASGGSPSRLSLHSNS